MKNLEIENCLKEWCESMLSKFPTITIFYEYSEKRNVYLVDTKVNLCDAEYDDFCIQAMIFEDEMNSRFDIDAPLFTENGELFSLSKDAKCFQRVSNTLEYTFVTYVKSLDSMNSQYFWDDYDAKLTESSTQQYSYATTTVALAA